MDAMRGGEKVLSFTGQQGSEEIKVKIPKGINTGQKLRLRGKGSRDPYTGRTGDLYVTVKVAEHPVFREGGKRYLREGRGEDHRRVPRGDGGGPDH